MSIDLLQLALLDPSPSTLDLLYLLDPGDEADEMIIESMMRLHGDGAIGFDPTLNTPHDLTEEMTSREAHFLEIGEGLDSYAWST